MDSNDQDDIIKKVKEAGNKEGQDDDKQDKSDDNAGGSDGDTVSNDFGGDMSGNQGSSDQGGEVSESKDGFSIKPKRLSIFATEGSKESKFKHKNIAENLENSKKNSTFVKNNIRLKLKETFNQENMENSVAEPTVKPTTKPAPTKQPNTTPSRRNKPFLPMPHPSVKPDPKAIKKESSDLDNNSIDSPRSRNHPDTFRMGRELAGPSKNVNDVIARISSFFKNKGVTDTEQITHTIDQAISLVKNRS